MLTGGAVLAVPEIGGDLPLGDLYANMKFSEVCSGSEPIMPASPHSYNTREGLLSRL